MDIGMITLIHHFRVVKITIKPGIYVCIYICIYTYTYTYTYIYI